MFSRYFLCLSLVNLLLLASLKERFICRELGCFLGVGDRDDFEKEVLVDKATGDGSALFWEAMVEPEVEAVSYFRE